MATSCFARSAVPAALPPSHSGFTPASGHAINAARGCSIRGRISVQFRNEPTENDDESREVGGEDAAEQSCTRRGLVRTAATLAFVSSCSFAPAQAFELGIRVKIVDERLAFPYNHVALSGKLKSLVMTISAGPREWLRGQKRKTAQFLINPIESSRIKLSTAVLLLSSAEGSSFENYEEAGRLVKLASRDCTPAESGSILDFQSRTGVEICTFKLVLKNAASLMPNDDPVKLRADAALKDLIKSFVAVDALFTSGGASAATQREDVLGALKDTMVALDTFQQGVQNCLDA